MIPLTQITLSGCEIPGSSHNDPFMASIPVQPSLSNGSPQTALKAPRLTTRTNNSGGVQGGISNGSPIYFRVGFKPPATIGQAQQTVDFSGKNGVLEAKGRHDPCVVPRAVPIVEAMTSLVVQSHALRPVFRQSLTIPQIMDALMEQGSRETIRNLFPGR